MEPNSISEEVVALNKFLIAINECFKANNEKLPQVCASTAVIREGGRKFIAIDRVSTGSRSVYCFVEVGSGNILKAAGFKAPAKGVRGNIYKPESYAKCDPFGSWLYLR